ncbi:ABC transporter ATP-binding protein [Sulfoacidibacillus thermotolerans]|uniref:Peptide ABC transporter ATP-binding protein n=1 Tax=Sulfoacidibacillus thermotolerans TaxID=1765684 RepID=A0A2U3D8L9_SULT2|nr:ABC transporter ATP-binding protein [Sulfoacidibacillus thermotolerans]PWI57630.1 peptide ABC transporter ATP-binding protein [Sulfoacidibacillus thermotolerans]
MSTLLEVSGVTTSFKTANGFLPAIEDVSFTIKKGETLGIVGESGCGKSVTSLSIMQLLTANGKIERGSIRFNGRELVGLKDNEMRKVRGNDIAMIFQEPMTSLNPVHKIGRQIGESLRIHKGYGKAQARAKAIELLKLVGIPRAEEIVDEYPHRLSGGMRQRVMIAIAMACNPQLLIADEPTTALDVTIQAQILDLMRKLKAELDMSIMLITHDLGVVAEMCDRVVVMYAGKVVEQGNVKDIFRNPSHPYTVGLLSSIPRLEGRQERLSSIPGNVPSLELMPAGCRFASRCPHATQRCVTEEPSLLPVSGEHDARCWLMDEKGVAV